MILQYLSLGSAFWRRTTLHPVTHAVVPEQSAYFNTSGFRQGSTVIWGHRSPGFIRVNATVVNLRCKEDLIGQKFECSGVEEYRGSARLLLRALAGKRDQEDGYIVSIASAEFGHIDFASHWKSAGTRIISSSFRRGEQETLLLVPRGSCFTTSLGTWRVACNTRTRQLQLS